MRAERIQRRSAVRSYDLENENADVLGCRTEGLESVTGKGMVSHDARGHDTWQNAVRLTEMSGGGPQCVWGLPLQTVLCRRRTYNGREAEARAASATDKLV